VLSNLHLPTGFALRIELDPTKELNVRMTVFRDGVRLAEVSSKAATVDRPGSLQRLVDEVTKTGSRGNGLQAAS
jgi:hypothetical protein